MSQSLLRSHGPVFYLDLGVVADRQLLVRSIGRRSSHLDILDGPRSSRRPVGKGWRHRHCSSHYGRQLFLSTSVSIESAYASS